MADLAKWNETNVVNSAMKKAPTEKGSASERIAEVDTM
jgi:hypothetical protein